MDPVLQGAIIMWIGIFIGAGLAILFSWVNRR